MMNEKKTHFLVFGIFLLLNLIFHTYVALSDSDTLLNWYLTDDAFYYFKTAQNIAEGNGITFDGLSPTNGFHPLWMTVCIPLFALAKYNLYLPLRLLIVLLGVLNAASGYLLYRILAGRLPDAAGVFAGILWMFLPPIHSVTTKLGLESGLNALSIFLLIYLVSRVDQGGKLKQNSSQLLVIGFAGVLCLFSRLDNIFLVCMMGIWLVFNGFQIARYALLDFSLIILSALTAYYLRIQTTDNILNFLPFANFLAVSSLLIKPILLYVFGAYGKTEGKSLRQTLLHSILSLAISSLLIFLLVFLLFDVWEIFRGYSRSVLLLDFALSTFLLTGVRVLRWKRCAVIGCDEQDVGFKRNWSVWFARAVAYFLPVLGSLAAYMAFNRRYAGSAMPVSGQVKHWWGRLPNTIYGQPIKNLSGIIGSLFDPDPETGPLWLVASPLHQATMAIQEFFNMPSAASSAITPFIEGILWIGLFALLFMLIFRYREEVGELLDHIALPALTVGCLIHILSFRATGYLHAKYWYWIAEMVLIFLFFGSILGIVFEHAIKRMANQRWGNRFLLALSIAIVFLFGSRILNEFPPSGEAKNLYDVEAEQRFINQVSAPGDVIGMTGGGLLGYFIPDRTWVNLDGLINSPRYFEMMKENRTEAYFKDIHLKYVYGDGEALLDSDPFRWMFTDRLRLAAKGPYFWFYEYCAERCE